jgi:hypothetical protein
MTLEPIRRVCCVCGNELPCTSKDHMIDINCAIKRGGEQYLYFCLNRHTEDEIAAAITGVPRFKKASDLKNGLV